MKQCLSVLAKQLTHLTAFDLILHLCWLSVPQIFREMQSLQELRFNWRDKMAPYHYVTSLSMGMQHYEDEHLLLGMYHVPLVSSMLATVCTEQDRVPGLLA